MSKIIYLCKTADEFIELCNIFKIEIDYNFISGGANYYLRVADGVPLVQGYTPWFPWEERFTDYRVTRYRKGMHVDAKDDVKSPLHYKLEGLELEGKDIIRSVLGKEGYKNWCRGTALKYLLRAGKKEDELKDFKKARVYLDWIIKEMEE